MAGDQADDGGTPVASVEVEVPQVAAQYSVVSDAQWAAMQHILNTVYVFRKPDPLNPTELHDPSKVFHRKVNKRVLPSYYDVIKEPIALSTVKAKIATRSYTNFVEFVRDFALIPHNAQVYNRQESGAYHDAIDVRALLEQELQKLVESKLISAEVAKLPYLGEIPPQDDLPPGVKEEDDEDEDDDDDDDEEAEDSDDSSRVKRRGRGRPRGSLNGVKKDASGGKDDELRIAEIEARKKRGRPPKVDTPMEVRIKNVLKGMRKFKNKDGFSRINSFDRLPDKAVMPEYFAAIKVPMAVDVLKKKLKRKKYQSFEQFMRDVEQMFENARVYNEDESEIYKDAVELQKEVRKIAQEEMNRSDTDFVMEDGRIPLPNGIQHNGELWKAGDWVHIQNPNDLTKPIVTQIYRTWQDSQGGKWVNACWYYRPEQTIHRFDRHFYENEVVKTGQYRDHQIDEIVDRCFVMFITRYNKGRPRGFPHDKEIYVCEARYNEEKHTLNKVKTWASCLPDEVRDKDYEMELYKEPKKMKKLPSPIAYLLKEGTKETEDMPKPEWGADNAPPKIGAVHNRPRDPKDSPPPEPTPSPIPEPVPPMPQQQQAAHITNTMSDNVVKERQSNFNPTATPRPTMLPSAIPPVTYNPTPQQIEQPTMSPAPLMRQASDSRMPGFSAHTPQATHTPRPPPVPVPASAIARYQPPQQTAAVPAAPSYINYKAPQPIEVWHLSDAANQAIPPDVLEQFQRDEHGHILFFTAPPLEVLPSEKQGAGLGHSVRYLAAKMKREAMLQEKRKREEEDGGGGLQEEKRRKIAAEREKAAKEEQAVTEQALRVWEQHLVEATKKEFRSLYGDEWKEKMGEHLDRLMQRQHEAATTHGQATELMKH